MMNTLNSLLSESELDPVFLGPGNGRFFRWKTDLYRGIAEDRAGLYNQLLTNGTFAALAEKGLVARTELAPFAIEGYPLVLKEQAVTFPSYPYEWSAPMLRDAALALLELELDLAKSNLTLRNAQSWKIMFEGCRPVFSDVDAITAAQSQPGWAASEEFCQFFLYPLRLMAAGQDRIA